jgi:hypothetical protein
VRAEDAESITVIPAYDCLGFVGCFQCFKGHRRYYGN